MSPPEFTNPCIDVSSAHAFMFGKCLYQYMTSCTYEYLLSKIDAEQLDFNLPIFRTTIGSKLKEIIKSTVQSNPNDRMNMNEIACYLDNMSKNIPKFNAYPIASSQTTPTTMEIEQQSSMKMQGH